VKKNETIAINPNIPAKAMITPITKCTRSLRKKTIIPVLRLPAAEFFLFTLLFFFFAILRFCLFLFLEKSFEYRRISLVQIFANVIKKGMQSKR
jgi:hypothetical protein